MTEVLEKAELIALPGASIVCPRCHATVGTLIKALYQHYSFGLDAIRFETGMAPKADHLEATCRSCGCAYSTCDVHLAPADGHPFERRQVITMFIHTDRGWLPKNPPPEIDPSGQLIIAPWV